MLDRTYLFLAICATTLMAGLTPFTKEDAKAQEKTPAASHVVFEKPEKPPVSSVRPEQNYDDVALPELGRQMRDPRVPPIAYWLRVAECETNSNWKDGGKFAGGLGIYTKGKFRDASMGTWEHFGGEDFALHPSGASMLQQIVIANRIAVFGYKTVVNRGAEKAKRMGVPQIYVFDQENVGFTGWGCIRNTVGVPKEWLKRNKVVVPRPAESLPPPSVVSGTQPR